MIPQPKPIYSYSFSSSFLLILSLSLLRTTPRRAQTKKLIDKCVRDGDTSREEQFLCDQRFQRLLFPSQLARLFHEYVRVNN